MPQIQTQLVQFSHYLIQLCFFNNCSLLADIDTIQELPDILVLYMAFLSDMKENQLAGQTKSWKKKLHCFSTSTGENRVENMQTWLIKAAERETSSTSFPSRISSSFTFSDRRIFTPSSISTFLTCNNRHNCHHKYACLRYLSY